jgi:hypothetical protein
MRAICRGGPLGGREWDSRSNTKGFLLENREVGEVIVYDYDDVALAFVARKPEPTQEDPEAHVNLTRAMLESKYDIVAYCDKRMGPWRL